MKIKLDIDCTPEEARAFLGLPDIAGIQNEMLEKFRDRMTANLKYADPQEMFKLWFPALWEPDCGRPPERTPGTREGSSTGSGSASAPARG